MNFTSNRFYSEQLLQEALNFETEKTTSIKFVLIILPDARKRGCGLALLMLGFTGYMLRHLTETNDVSVFIRQTTNNRNKNASTTVKKRDQES